MTEQISIQDFLMVKDFLDNLVCQGIASKTYHKPWIVFTLDTVPRKLVKIYLGSTSISVRCLGDCEIEEEYLYSYVELVDHLCTIYQNDLKLIDS